MVMTHESIPAGAMGSLEDAARVAGVSTRTLQKWHDEGEFAEGEWVRLKARRGRGNAYAILLTAAVRVARDHWTPPRYTPLPPALPAAQSTPQSAEPSRVVRPAPVRTAPRRAVPTRDLRPANIPPLPDTWESVSAATQRHGMQKNWREAWQRRMRSGALPVHQPDASVPSLRGGPWWCRTRTGGKVVRYAFDPEGLRVLGQLYRDTAEWWTDCTQPGCPACASADSSLTQGSTDPYNEDVQIEQHE